ncbi:MAG: type II secretion system protein [Patescibacteria group bacterium]
MKKAGFTLIELLVVISIISLLSSVVLTSVNSARAKARDARRLADVSQLVTALQFYYDANNAFPPTPGCVNGWCCLGHGDGGRCWANNYTGNTALDNGLAPYLPKIPDDPLNNTSRYGDAYMYRVDNDALGTYATLHWGVEKSNPTTQDCAGGTIGNWGAGLGIGSNYYCMLPIR